MSVKASQHEGGNICCTNSTCDAVCCSARVQCVTLCVCVCVFAAGVLDEILQSSAAEQICSLFCSSPETQETLKRHSCRTVCVCVCVCLCHIPSPDVSAVVLQHSLPVNRLNLQLPQLFIWIKTQNHVSGVSSNSNWSKQSGVSGGGGVKRGILCVSTRVQHQFVGLGNRQRETEACFFSQSLCVTPSCRDRKLKE